MDNRFGMKCGARIQLKKKLKSGLLKVWEKKKFFMDEE
jgi:hypothetical protein